MKRETRIAICLFALLLMAILYHVAPEDNKPGEYKIKVYAEVDSEILTISSVFRLGKLDYSQISVREEVKDYTVILEHQRGIPHSPGNRLAIYLKILKNGETVRLSLENIKAEIEDPTGRIFRIPFSKKSGDYVVAEFVPLIKMREATALLGLVAVLWFTEAIPLSVTALVIAVFEVLLGLLSAREALTPFFSPVVVLIMGGLLIARALNKHGADRYLARLMFRSGAASRNTFLLLVLLATAFLSFWLPNTVTAVIMLPIVLGVLDGLKKKNTNFEKAVLLAIAYAANTGGIGTMVGTTTPPIAVELLNTILGLKITFTDWLLYGLPAVFVILPLCWLLLKLFYRFPNEPINLDIRADSMLSKDQKLAMLGLAFTAFLWLTEKIHGIPNSIVALIGAILLFLTGTLEVKDFKEIDWSVIILLGGGLSLGEALVKTGLAHFIAFKMGELPPLHPLLLLLITNEVSIFVTTFLSNTAAAAILSPIYIPLAIALKMDPRLVVIQAAITSSTDFILPVGTPPNAVVYGTGRISLKEMIKTGLTASMISTVLLTTVVTSIWAAMGIIAL